jgi:ubiquitin C-terminal hydrolase
MSSVSQCMIVSRAKAKRLATKQTQLLSAPRHLLLGLVLFSQTMHGRRLTATKNMALVSIEQEITLNVGKCMHQYDLYAVLVHEGQSLHKGHYYTYACNPSCTRSVQVPEWHCYDDDKVELVPEDYLEAFLRGEQPRGRHGSATPYLLCYCLRQQERTVEKGP